MYYNNSKILGSGQASNKIWRLNSDVNYHQPVRNYLSDGMGRDTYISYPNGGFIKNQCTANPATGFQFSSSPQKLHPTKTGGHTNVVFYKPDGTGRDFYITSSHGGFVEKFDNRPVIEKFSSSLRKHSIKTLKNNKAIQNDSLLNFNKRSTLKQFRVSQNNGQETWYSQKDQMAEMIQGIEQRQSSNRLSMPKKVYKKWDELRTDFDKVKSTRASARSLASSRYGKSELCFTKQDQNNSRVKINLMYSKVQELPRTNRSIDKVYTQNYMMKKSQDCRRSRNEIKNENSLLEQSQRLSRISKLISKCQGNDQKLIPTDFNNKNLYSTQAFYNRRSAFQVSPQKNVPPQTANEPIRRNKSQSIVNKRISIDQTRASTAFGASNHPDFGVPMNSFVVDKNINKS